jgi:carotenoid cleavage dioxygenase-like enzyme
MGVAWDLEDGLRSQLLILDAEHLEDGPVASVKLPLPAAPQIHGWWVREDQYPA